MVMDRDSNLFPVQDERRGSWEDDSRLSLKPPPRGKKNLVVKELYTHVQSVAFILMLAFHKIASIAQSRRSQSLIRYSVRSGR